MRVAIVNNFARVTGGADRHCLDLAAELRSRGHEIAFLATSDPRNIEHQGRFVSCEMTGENRDSIRGTAAALVVARSLWNREAASAMKELVEDFEPDVVHAHKLYPQLSVAPIVVARRSGLPVVQTVHDYELISASALDHRGSALDRQETSLRYRALNDATFPIRRRVHAPRVQQWVAVSRAVARHLLTKGIDARVIPNFVEPVSQVPPESDRDGVSYVSRLAPEKGVMDVIDLANGNPEIEVTVAGDGPLANEVSSWERSLPNLTYRGLLDKPQVTEMISRSKAILIPSRWEEPGGITALEAMAVGTPVVAYRSGGLPEYVEETGAGVVIEPSPTSLAEVALKVASGGADWRRLSAAGPIAVRDLHSAERCVGMYLEVYGEAAFRSS
jgi:glycosyltransferase involved in cell wall biosynthesis